MTSPPAVASGATASTAAPAPGCGTVLAFDFGEKRIGVAVGDLGFRQANALDTIAAPTNAQRFAAIARHIDEWQPVRLVVGVPRSAEGADHAMTARCTRFANQLRGRFRLAVDEVDERLSSWEAAQQRRGRSVPGRRAGGLDAEAARVILQSYFDEPARS